MNNTFISIKVNDKIIIIKIEFLTIYKIIQSIISYLGEKVWII